MSAGDSSAHAGSAQRIIVNPEQTRSAGGQEEYRSSQEGQELWRIRSAKVPDQHQIIQRGITLRVKNRTTVGRRGQADGDSTAEVGRQRGGRGAELEESQRGIRGTSGRGDGADGSRFDFALRVLGDVIDASVKDDERSLNDAVQYLDCRSAAGRR